MDSHKHNATEQSFECLEYTQPLEAETDPELKELGYVMVLQAWPLLRVLMISLQIEQGYQGLHAMIQDILFLSFSTHSNEPICVFGLSSATGIFFPMPLLTSSESWSPSNLFGHGCGPESVPKASSHPIRVGCWFSRCVVPDRSKTLSQNPGSEQVHDELIFEGPEALFGPPSGLVTLWS